MSLKTRAEFSKRQTSLHRKISRVRHRGITHRANMSIGEKKPVAILPLRAFRVVLQYAEVKRGKNIRHAQRPRSVAASRRNEHFNYRLTDLICAPLKFANFLIR